MTEQERDRSEDEARPRRVKVTDKRRVRPDADPGKNASQSAPGAPSPEGASDAEVASGGATMTSAENAGAEKDAVRAPGIGAPKEAADAPRSELERARSQAAEYLEHLQRLQAEFENYRKRILREQTRAVEMASEAVVSRLLEVIDEFELALVAAEHGSASEKFIRGVEMVYAKLLDVLKAEGLERLEPVGEPFDPQLHEALLQSDGEKEGEPYVEDVLRTGYRLKGRVIRPAGVKVGRR